MSEEFEIPQLAHLFAGLAGNDPHFNPLNKRQGRFRNDIERLWLAGGVAGVTVEEYPYRRNFFGKWTQAKTPESSTNVAFDVNGNLLTWGTLRYHYYGSTLGAISINNSARRIEFEYDEKNRLAITRETGEVVVHARSLYQYDSLGRCTKVTDYDKSDKLQFKTTYLYGAQNEWKREVTTRHDLGEEFEMSSTTYVTEGNGLFANQVGCIRPGIPDIPTRTAYHFTSSGLCYKRVQTRGVASNTIVFKPEEGTVDYWELLHGGGQRIIYCRFDFDERGNWIRRHDELEGPIGRRPLKLTIRKIAKK